MCQVYPDTAAPGRRKTSLTTLTSEDSHTVMVRWELNLDLPIHNSDHATVAGNKSNWQHMMQFTKFKMFQTVKGISILPFRNNWVFVAHVFLAFMASVPSRKRWLLQDTWSHLWFPVVHECPLWYSIVYSAVMVHQISFVFYLFCLLSYLK